MANTKKRESAQTYSPLLAEFIAKTDELLGVCQTVKNVPSRLKSHQFYAQKGRAAYAELKQSYKQLVAAHPVEAHPSLKAHFDELAAFMDDVKSAFPGDVPALMKALKQIKLIASTELSIALKALGAVPPPVVVEKEFIPSEILENHDSTYQKILWEINVCYEKKCFNAAAVLIRRLVESLVILAFEANGIAGRIKDGDGNYFMLKGLIGAAGGSPELKLGRTVREGLPKSKFFGDLGAHNPRTLVRESDLKTAHDLIRVTIEEIAGHSARKNRTT